MVKMTEIFTKVLSNSENFNQMLMETYKKESLVSNLTFLLSHPVSSFEFL